MNELIKNTLSYIFIGFFILALLFIVVKNTYIKKHSKEIEILASISIAIGLIGGFISYTTELKKNEAERNSSYINNIVSDFLKIDDFLIENYDDLNIIFYIFYNKINYKYKNNKVNFNIDFSKISDKTINLTIVLFNKITYLMEKMYIVNPDLFNNDMIGLKIKLYIENDLFKEYWSLNYNLYRNDFIEFMYKKYSFLIVTTGLNSNVYKKINFIPNTKDYDFLY